MLKKPLYGHCGYSELKNISNFLIVVAHVYLIFQVNNFNNIYFYLLLF